MAKPVPSQYDAFAGGYASFAETAPYNALYDRPATLDLIGEVDGLRILDAACGPGFYAEQLLAKGAHVVACDGSAAMVDLARERLGDGVAVHVQSLDEPLTWLDDGSLDLVVCALAYHYLNDRPSFLAEVHRVLRPGGSVVISTHHPTDDWVRLGGSYFDVAAVAERWSRGWEVTAWRLPLTLLTEEFADAGFAIERLVEPKPLAAMATSHPDAFEKLSQHPAFILFRLRRS